MDAAERLHFLFSPHPQEGLNANSFDRRPLTTDD